MGVIFRVIVWIMDDFPHPRPGIPLRHLRYNGMGVMTLHTNTAIRTGDASECRYPKINTVMRTYIRDIERQAAIDKLAPSSGVCLIEMNAGMKNQYCDKSECYMGLQVWEINTMTIVRLT